ncbi:acyltransferase [bacterium]|nr:acyltransferase [bacterium]
MQVTGNGAVIVGKFTDISPDVEIVFLCSEGVVHIGDYCRISAKVKIVVNHGSVFIDDWTAIHDGCLLLCSKFLKIGQHCWFGQHCVLDGTAGLTIGNSVRVGMYSQIWSHVAAGEQFEGCILNGEKPVHIEDNVWLVGSCICSPGVTLGRFAIALSQSNIIKSVAEYQVVAGSPASLKPKMSFYKNITLKQKFNLITDWLYQFNYKHNQKYDIELSSDKVQISSFSDKIHFFCSSVDYHESKKQNNLTQNISVDLEVKVYTKKHTALEKTLFQFFSNNKVRFLRDDG